MTTRRPPSSDASPKTWVLRIQQGALSDTEKNAFSLWRAVPENMAAYSKAGLIWGAIDQVASAPEILQVRESILAKTGEAKTARWRRGVAVGIAASVAAMIVGAVLFAQNDKAIVSSLHAVLGVPFAPAEGTYRTTVGERSTVTLRDGSILNLNTNSEAEVTFTDSERRVVLRHGQALFEVAKNQPRPFVVYAGDRRIVATGTAFDVRLGNAGVEVTLVEGHVLVDRPGIQEVQKTHRPAELKPGERLVAKVGTDDSVDSANVERITSWTAGKLVFLDTRLDAAIAETNRYTRTPIQLADDKLGRLPVNGVFRAGQPAEFARAIAQIYPLDIAYQSDGQIRIAAKSD